MLRTTDATSAIDLLQTPQQRRLGRRLRERDSEKETHKRRMRNTMQKNRRQRINRPKIDDTKCTWEYELELIYREMQRVNVN